MMDKAEARSAPKAPRASGVGKWQLFKLIWRGWFVAGTVLFSPILLVLSLTGDRPRELLIAVFMAPLIFALQGLLFGALVLLGLRIWPPRDP
jgi:hypothetical protein